MPTNIRDFQRLVAALYQATAALEEMFPARSFPICGELADQIAESFAECFYGVQFEPAEENPEPRRDVLVKSAQGGKVRLERCPKQLLVLRIYANGTFDEVYNGPGEWAWQSIPPEAKRSRDGGNPVPLSLLRQLMRDMPGAQRLPRTSAPQAAMP